MLSSSVVHFTDVLSKGVWQTIESLQDPDLKQGQQHNNQVCEGIYEMESLGRATN